jgi:uncharacterized phiE125 gp8 family phage protein
MSFGSYIGGANPALIVGNVRNTQQYTYDITVPPITTPISLALVKTHLKIELVDVENDAYLEFLITAATNFFQNYTNKITINTTFRTFFDQFRQSFELARSKLNTLLSFDYLVNGSWVTIDSTMYAVTYEENYSRLYFPTFDVIPTDKDDLFQSIRVNFIAGYGDTDSSVPSDIKLGLLNHIADMYENRGDCGDCSCIDIESLPPLTRDIYIKYRHMSAFGSPFRG